jgi:2-polyprenyl-3-methyl-5-hydroxy-6-metoxy-1,4-benzoquinol methylase
MKFIFPAFGNYVKRRFGFAPQRAIEMPSPCMHCGCRYAFPFAGPSLPDFDVSQLPYKVAECLTLKRNGTCCCCGLLQAYMRPNFDELKIINQLGKDATTSDPAYGGELALADGIEKFRANYIDQRLDRWSSFFSGLFVKPKRVLFLRCWFGDTAIFARDNFGCQIFGADMSKTCLDYVSENCPSLQLLEGDINGHLAGPLIKSGPYDAIFSWHVLTHAVDVHHMLRQIDSLLSPGGFFFLTHEVGPKPHNPFHMLHLGEVQLKMLLAEHFNDFQAISDCNSRAAHFVRLGSPRYDEADYIVWKRS